MKRSSVHEDAMTFAYSAARIHRDTVRWELEAKLPEWLCDTATLKRVSESWVWERMLPYWYEHALLDDTIETVSRKRKVQSLSDAWEKKMSHDGATEFDFDLQFKKQINKRPPAMQIFYLKK